MELGSISLYPIVNVKVGRTFSQVETKKPEPERAAREFQGRTVKWSGQNEVRAGRHRKVGGGGIRVQLETDGLSVTSAMILGSDRRDT